MSIGHGALRAAAAAWAAAALFVSGAAATQTELPVLGRLETGLWQLRNLGNGREIAAICLGDRALLLQPRHRSLRCSRTVVATTRDTLEVRYTCPAAFGQTTIRVETSRLARVESQGVDNGIPFGFRAEARRIGACR